ncbi:MULTISPECIES: spore cortex-lytic enzyme [Carboxydocella]|nr:MULTISPECIES: spore cortex-lytic enzyme [Carboxydocella]
MERKTLLGMLMIFLLLLGWGWHWAEQSLPAISRTLFWGSSGADVRSVQAKLKAWGYYTGPIDGIYGSSTWTAVRKFQRANGLTPDGVVGPATLKAMGLWTSPARAVRTTTTISRGLMRRNDLTLLARLVQAEAGGEPYEGQVAVAAVVLNRVASPLFPNTIADVIFQPLAFESVSNGLINRPPSATALQAARDALNGYDPTQGALFFWNPSKPVSSWIWSRPIIRRIGDHVFAR